MLTTSYQKAGRLRTDPGIYYRPRPIYPPLPDILEDPYEPGEDLTETAAKIKESRKRILDKATSYLRGEQLFIASAMLRGPIVKNPWTGNVRTVAKRKRADLDHDLPTPKRIAPAKDERIVMNTPEVFYSKDYNVEMQMTVVKEERDGYVVEETYNAPEWPKNHAVARKLWASRLETFKLDDTGSPRLLLSRKKYTLDELLSLQATRRAEFKKLSTGGSNAQDTLVKYSENNYGRSSNISKKSGLMDEEHWARKRIPQERPPTEIIGRQKSFETPTVPRQVTAEDNNGREVAVPRTASLPSELSSSYRSESRGGSTLIPGVDAVTKEAAMLQTVQGDSLSEKGVVNCITSLISKLKPGIDPSDHREHISNGSQLMEGPPLPVLQRENSDRTTSSRHSGGSGNASPKLKESVIPEHKHSPAFVFRRKTKPSGEQQTKKETTNVSNRPDTRRPSHADKSSEGDKEAESDCDERLPGPICPTARIAPAAEQRDSSNGIPHHSADGKLKESSEATIPPAENVLKSGSNDISSNSTPSEDKTVEYEKQRQIHSERENSKEAEAPQNQDFKSNGDAPGTVEDSAIAPNVEQVQVARTPAVPGQILFSEPVMAAPPSFASESALSSKETAESPWVSTQYQLDNARKTFMAALLDTPGTGTSTDDNTDNNIPNSTSNASRIPQSSFARPTQSTVVTIQECSAPPPTSPPLGLPHPTTPKRTSMANNAESPFSPFKTFSSPVPSYTATSPLVRLTNLFAASQESHGPRPSCANSPMLFTPQQESLFSQHPRQRTVPFPDAPSPKMYMSDEEPGDSPEKENEFEVFGLQQSPQSNSTTMAGENPITGPDDGDLLTMDVAQILEKDIWDVDNEMRKMTSPVSASSTVGAGTPGQRVMSTPGSIVRRRSAKQAWLGTGRKRF